MPADVQRSLHRQSLPGAPPRAFNRRISESEFDEVVADLCPRSPPGQLVIDISDIAALDSKGEGKIEDAMADTLANGGRAALVIDPSRRWLYVALEAIAEVLGGNAAVKYSSGDAVAFVMEAA